MATPSMEPISFDHDTARPRELRRAMAASFIGTMVEYYDFLLYATAATLVFGPLFFSGLPPWAATLVSFATLAVGYLARPIGAVVFGHFGDRIGRKRTLIITLTVMGGASVLIGCLPTTAMIGPAAGIILIVLRTVQGVAIGGEWGGAVLLSAEHSGARRRGFAASFTNAGAPAGSVLGTLMFALFSQLPSEQFLAWGWRVPFLLSAVLVVYGLVLRTRVSESPAFVEAAQENGRAAAVRRAPLVEVLRHPIFLLRIALAFMANGAISIVVLTVAVSYAIAHGADQSQVLLASSCALFVQIFTIPAFAALSDRVGRKKVMIGALVGAIVWAVGLFPALGTGNIALVALAFFVAMPGVLAAIVGPLPSFLAEQFRTEERYTGISIGYQLSNVLGGLVPLILTALMGPTMETIGATIFLVAVYLVSAVVLSTLRERRGEEFAEIG